MTAGSSRCMRIELDARLEPIGFNDYPMTKPRGPWHLRSLPRTHYGRERGYWRADVTDPGPSVDHDGASRGPGCALVDIKARWAPEASAGLASHSASGGPAEGRGWCFDGSTRENRRFVYGAYRASPAQVRNSGNPRSDREWVHRGEFRTHVRSVRGCRGATRPTRTVAGRHRRRTRSAGAGGRIVQSRSRLTPSVTAATLRRIGPRLLTHVFADAPRARCRWACVHCRVEPCIGSRSASVTAAVLATNRQGR